MNKNEFEKFMEEMLPLIEKMIEVAKKYNPDNKLISVACSKDGYFHMQNHRFKGWATRLISGGKVEIVESRADDVPV